MSSKKSAGRRALYSEARKYLDMKILFPESKNVGKKPLTDYQAKKISKELRHLAALTGGESRLDKLIPALKAGTHYLANDFVPVRRTKSAPDYFADALIPASSKGVLLKGGKKVNSGVTIKNGALFYNRGGTHQAAFPLNAINEIELEKSIRAHSGYINNPDNVTYLGTAGGTITGVNVLVNEKRGLWKRERGVSIDAGLEGDDSEDEVVAIALSIFLKYEAMANNGELRAKRGRAVHPSKWGMSLIIEAK